MILWDNLSWMTMSNEMSMVIRLVVAAFLGGIIGIERGSGVIWL